MKSKHARGVSGLSKRKTITGKLSRRVRDTRAQWLKDLDAKRTQIDIDFAKRHPSVAKEQRSLRKARAVMLERWSHKNAGTPETHERFASMHEGALAQLHINGTIDREQLEWSAEIDNVYRSIQHDVAVKVASFEARVDQSRRPIGAIEGVRRVRLHYAYGLWRASLPAPKQMILDMIVGDRIGYTVAARRYGVHNRKAKRLLIAAIDAWPTMVERAHRAVSSDDVKRMGEI